MVQRISPFEPINQVTPFTYRDNETYLSLLNRIRKYINTLVSALNDLDIVIHGELNEAVEELTRLFEGDLESLRDELITLIVQASGQEALTFDPTTGKRYTAYSQALSNVYDNVRVYAYFASDLDGMNLTAQELDEQQVTARHFDLGYSYPVFNDVNGTD